MSQLCHKATYTTILDGIDSLIVFIYSLYLGLAYPVNALTHNM